MINYLIAFVVILVPALATAAPSITGTSGTFNHNASVTVSGSSFGTKSPAAPVFVDFLTGYTGYTNGQTIPTAGGCPNEADQTGCTGANPYGWTETATGWRVGYKTTNARGKFTAAYSNSWTGNENGLSAIGGKDLGTSPVISEKLYLTWYTYVSQDPMGGGQSNKFCRVMSTSEWDAGDGGSVFMEGNQYIHIFNWSDDHDQNWWDEWSGTWPAWNRIELYVDGTTNPSPTVYAWTNNTLDATRQSDTNYAWRIRYIGNLGADAANNPMGTVDWNTIYADNTLARIEICDAATKSGSTHCEIQIPSAWSTSSATFTVNQGSFADSSTAYLYVIDSTGDPNASGTQITFGSGGGAVNTTLSGGTFTGRIQ